MSLDDLERSLLRTGEAAPITPTDREVQPQAPLTPVQPPDRGEENWKRIEELEKELHRLRAESAAKTSTTSASEEKSKTTPEAERSVLAHSRVEKEPFSIHHDYLPQLELLGEILLYTTTTPKGYGFCIVPREDYATPAKAQKAAYRLLQRMKGSPPPAPVAPPSLNPQSQYGREYNEHHLNLLREQRRVAEIQYGRGSLEALQVQEQIDRLIGRIP
jgi:hypothetical protein